jgi:hypothetical protein
MIFPIIAIVVAWHFLKPSAGISVGLGGGSFSASVGPRTADSKSFSKDANSSAPLNATVDGAAGKEPWGPMKKVPNYSLDEGTTLQ